MPKMTYTFDPALYAPVAERIRLFYASHPDGRIVTELQSCTTDQVVFKASVFRSNAELNAAATGWASERVNDGDINRVACLENTETSAVGRALANLGFTASRNRPSREEMQKADRVRRRRMHVVAPSAHLSIHEATADAYGLDEEPLQHRANQLLDLLHLIERAVARGLRSARAARWRSHLLPGRYSDADLSRWEERLREWVTRER